MKVIEVRDVRLSRVVMRSTMRAVCPLTNITDIYEVVVEYKPANGRYVEAYSFEEFLKSFESKKIFQEEVTRLIAEEVCASGAAEQVKVTLRGTHGGVELVTELEKNCKG